MEFKKIPMLFALGLAYRMCSIVTIATCYTFLIKKKTVTPMNWQLAS